MRNINYSSKAVKRFVSLAVLTTFVVASSAACSGSDRTDTGERSKLPLSQTSNDTKISGETGDLKDPVGAIASVSKFECEADKSGAWSATMEVTNTTDKKANFLVRVSVIKEKTSEVIGTRTKKVKLDAGAIETVEIVDFAQAEGKSLACSRRVIRGT